MGVTTGRVVAGAAVVGTWAWGVVVGMLTGTVAGTVAVVAVVAVVVPDEVVVGVVGAGLPTWKNTACSPTTAELVGSTSEVTKA